ncbi:MAG TPA: QueT transporter family protein [Candidatus Fimimorpha excrementavium]|nr:QueT transporter family protein [Candidatus Fimimorpha excrementavium]
MKAKNVSMTSFLTQGGVIAAIYVVLTLLFQAISFGPIQFRISELLCVLPYFTPAAIPGLFIGCLLGNILGGAAIYDIIFGSLATLIGALGSYAIRRHKPLVALPPILANTLIIPFVLRYAYAMPDALWYLMATVGIGEILAIGVLGTGVMYLLDKNAYVAGFLRGSIHRA